MNPRRRFIGAALALPVRALDVGAARWWRANPLCGSSRPVRIPLDAVTAPWRLWYSLRTAGVGTARAHQRRCFERTRLSALCVTCPHEQCQVDLVTIGALARMPGTSSHPLFECGCHLSLFDAATRAPALGRDPRGLYRFRMEVHDGIVEITEIEVWRSPKCDVVTIRHPKS